MFEEYGRLDQEIYRVESGTEPASDDYTEALKKKRLMLKTSMFELLRKAA